MDDLAAHRLPSGATPAQVSLRVGLALTQFDLDELWIACIAGGGYLTRADVGVALITGAPTSYDLLAQGLNDELWSTDLAYRVPYLDELADLGR